MPLTRAAAKRLPDRTGCPSDGLAVLDSNAELVAAISTATGDASSTVVERLLNEHRDVGSNANRAMAERGIRTGVPSDALDDFYRSSSAPLYEACVWNRFRAKRQMRHWTLDFLRRQLDLGDRVLAFGDGPGFDSAALASAGFDVAHFDVSNVCRAFATELFDRAGCGVNVLDDTSSVDKGSLDCIVCLDVLEHLADVEAVIERFANWLSPGGLLVVHAPFYLVDVARSTHLRSNTIYSGDTSVFARNGLHVVAGQVFLNPIVFRKGARTTAGESLWPVRLGQPLFKLGRRFPTQLGWIANQLIRQPNEWIPELEQMANGSVAVHESVSRHAVQVSVQSTAQIRHFK